MMNVENAKYSPAISQQPIAENQSRMVMNDCIRIVLPACRLLPSWFAGTEQPRSLSDC
jgi:hypothetical protein